MPLNVPIMTTLEHIAEAQHVLVVYALWIGLAILTSAAASMGVVLLAMAWNERDIGKRQAGSPYDSDRLDPAIRRLEREGINRLTYNRYK